MKANEIFEYIKNHAAEIREPTCDGLIAGDPEKEVKKLAVCFKLTAELVAKAAAEHFDMIVTHEPTFSQGDRKRNLNTIDQKKRDLLDSTGITVYRLHDHAHTEPDYIHAGFIRTLGLHIAHKYPRESLGICRYSFREKLTVRQLCQRIKETLDPNFVGIVGDPDLTAETVCLGLGGVGLEQISVLMEPGCDVFITGETDELFACEYVRDACYFGERKAVILLGHCGAEYAGMRYLAECLNDTLLPTEYLHCGEVYLQV